MPNAFLRLPIKFQNICKIYPPCVNDVLTIDNYTYYHNLFTISQEDIEDMLVEQNKISDREKIPTPFKFLLSQAYNNPQSYKMIREAFNFFCHTPITILFDKEEIWMCDLEKELQYCAEEDEDEEAIINRVMKIPKLNSENYFDFQNCIRQSLGEQVVEKPNPNEHPKIRAMKAKARYRDRVKAKQGNGITLKTSLTALCCMGIGITPLNIGELSLSAISDIMKMRQEKEKYEIDIKSLLAGANSKKIKPKYWIHN